MREAEARKQICEIGRRVYERGMVAANDGNISVRLEDGSILCTPTGVSKGFMEPEHLCRIGMDGAVLEAAPGFRPSSEMKMHLRVFRERSDVNAVVHTHSPYATTFAILRRPLDAPIMSEASLLNWNVPVAPYATPSTEEVPDSITPFVKDNRAVLLANHGVLTWGKDLVEAFMLMESVEQYARLIYQTELLGGGCALSGKQLNRIRGILGMPLSE